MLEIDSRKFFWIYELKQAITLRANYGKYKFWTNTSTECHCQAGAFDYFAFCLTKGFLIFRPKWGVMWPGLFCGVLKRRSWSPKTRHPATGACGPVKKPPSFSCSSVAWDEPVIGWSLTKSEGDTTKVITSDSTLSSSEIENAKPPKKKWRSASLLRGEP